jgi:flagellar biosynthesis protein FlhB
VSEKTEEPTPRRLARAREKGEIAVSHATSQAFGFLVALFVVPGTIAATAFYASAMFYGALRPLPLEYGASALATRVVLLVAPLLTAVAAAAAFSTVLQTGALFAPSRMKPELGKLDPLAGLRSLVGAERLWSIARALAAAVTVAFLAWRALSMHLADLAATIGRAESAIEVMARAGKQVARDAALVGLLLAIIDLVVVRRAFRTRLKMTRAELKQEHRESEGDPEWKAARRRAHQEMIAAATVSAVKDATVVIVNPEHFATALRYVDGEDEAPTVLATGDGDLARRIQEAARAYGIPIVRDVPVARALSELQAGDTIPEALYEAVAAILQEVWREEEQAQAP